MLKRALSVDFRRVSAVVVAALAIAACGSSQPATGAKQFNLMFISQGFPNPHTQMEWNGAKARATELGAKIDISDAAFDAVKQVNQFEDALTSGKYDGYLVNCLDCSAIIPVLNKATKAGKKVVTIASPVSGTPADTGYFPGTVAHINVTPVAQGKVMAREVLGALPNGGNMVLIEGVAGQTGNEDFKKGFTSVMSGHPEIKILADQHADWDPTKATTVLQAILQAHPHQIDLLLTWADEMTVGPAEYLDAQGLVCKWPAQSCQGKIKIVGHDLAKGGFDQLNKGNLISDWPTLPYQHGYIGVGALVDALNGKQVPTHYDAHPSPPCPSSGDCTFTPDSIKNVTDPAKQGFGY